ncbi:uncharacterized protein LOC143911645 [Arctopsyche grandis]|uniref:uncharacterized protein LOC143911645 n=1 Tax=Arctopsyche grandis TaxID=121162 RepID=UPI00406D97F1
MKLLFLILGGFLFIQMTATQDYDRTALPESQLPETQPPTQPATQPPQTRPPNTPNPTKRPIPKELSQEADDTADVKAPVAYEGSGARGLSGPEGTSSEEDSLMGVSRNIGWAYRYCRYYPWTPRCKCFKNWFKRCYMTYRPHPLCNCISRSCNWWQRYDPYDIYEPSS